MSMAGSLWSLATKMSNSAAPIPQRGGEQANGPRGTEMETMHETHINCIACRQQWWIGVCARRAKVISLFKKTHSKLFCAFAKCWQNFAPYRFIIERDFQFWSHSFRFGAVDSALRVRRCGKSQERATAAAARHGMPEYWSTLSDCTYQLFASPQPLGRKSSYVHGDALAPPLANKSESATEKFGRT